MVNLSQENINKIIKTGLYEHKPDKKYRGEIYIDNLFWCYNWTFTPAEYKGKWYMYDTYFKNKSIELTDANFEEFSLIFDFNNVEKHGGHYIEEYEDGDWWRVATDSGGWYYPKYYIKKGAKKNKEKVLERIQREINHHEWELARARDTYDDVLNDRRCLEYV